MSENSGKTVEVKELPSKKIRIFDDRKSFDVDIPVGVRDTTENCPLSVTITPMTHREAEVRKRIKKALTVEMNNSNRIAGISQSDIRDYNEAFSEIIKNDECLSDDDYLEKMENFQDEWDDFRAKVESKDLTAYYAEEDRLHDNALDVIAKNVQSLNWEDNSVSIDRSVVENLHPDLLSWLLVQIEINSYLDEGEIVGF